MRTRKGVVLVTLLASSLACLSSVAVAQSLDAQLKPVVDEVISGCSQAGAQRITVADFTDLQGQVTELGRFLAEELGVSLMMARPKFGLVDRANLRTILAEHKLSMSGLVNPDTAKRLGQLAGVDGIVIGTITPLGDSIRLTVKVVGTETATLMAAARTEIARTEAIRSVEGRSIQAGAAAGAGPQASSSGPSAGQGPVPTAGPAGPMPTAQSGEFQFAARGCRRVGDIVKCSVSVTNAGARRGRINVCSSSLVDDLGTSAGHVRVSFGGSSCGEDLEPGLPLTFSLETDRLSPEARLINVLLKDGSWGSFRPTTLRNIPLVK